MSPPRLAKIWDHPITPEFATPLNPIMYAGSSFHSTWQDSESRGYPPGSVQLFHVSGCNSPTYDVLFPKCSRESYLWVRNRFPLFPKVPNDPALPLQSHQRVLGPVELDVTLVRWQGPKIGASCPFKALAKKKAPMFAFG